MRQTAPAGLQEVIAEVAAGQSPRRKVRDILGWINAMRRGVVVMAQVDGHLAAARLVTDPDWKTVWIDEEVTFRPMPDPAPGDAADPVEARRGQPAPTPDAATEAQSHAVRMLESAHRNVISVAPNDDIGKAITLMLLHDYSQLAVMVNERGLKGAISWKSIGMRLSQGRALRQVADALEPAEAVDDTTSLFEVTRRIVDQDYVFVRAADKKISGIVTASDLSRQFQALSEPFLMLGRIEAHLRRMIDAAFTTAEIRAAAFDGDEERKKATCAAAQLTFGEYLRLLETEANWSKLGLVACRKTFRDALDQVRVLRNDIMHFHPDSLDGRNLDPLRRFLGFLDTMAELRA